jgi:hypothetical protein
MEKTKTTAVSTDNAITPEPVSFSLTGSALTLNVNCGLCRHHSRMAHPALKKVCREKGILEEAKPCARFSADPRQIKFSDDEQLLAVSEWIGQAPKKKLLLLAALLTQEERTRKQGRYFGEVVYILALGGEYITNYRRCRVVSAVKDYVTVEGQGIIATVMTSSVLSIKQWKKKKALLAATGKKRDPRYKTYFQAPSKVDEEIKQVIDNLRPPTLSDSVVNVKRKSLLEFELNGGFKATKKKVKKKIVHYVSHDNYDMTPVDVIVKTRGTSIVR